MIITLPKKGNLQICNNYRTISLISHPSKVMLKVLLNRLKPQAEEIIAEEQAGFRIGRSTTEQIFNLRIICEKYLQHQQDLYHVFIDFKKAFDRVWHAALWTIMRQYNIGNNLIRVKPGVHTNDFAPIYGRRAKKLGHASLATVFRLGRLTFQPILRENLESPLLRYQPITTAVVTDACLNTRWHHGAYTPAASRESLGMDRVVTMYVVQSAQ